MKSMKEIKISDLLQRMLDYGDRFSKEPPVSEFEKQGRLLALYGVICKAAEETCRFEKESRTTLLSFERLDYDRLITRIEAYQGAVRVILIAVPLFRVRNYLKYPQITIDDLLLVREKFMKMEKLPNCDNGMAKRTDIDITSLAYNIYDIIFLGLGTIATTLRQMRDDKLMLSASHELRVKRWNLMMKRYQDSEWEKDKRLFLDKFKAYTTQFGYEKETLEMFLNQLDHEATVYLANGMLASLNLHYLHQDDHLSYIFDHRHELKQEHINRHLCFICCRKLVEQEIELFDLRQPAAGADADLFTCRAAKELVELLIPLIKVRVDFDYSYQFAAWVKAMMDLNLIYSNKDEKNKRNGTLIVNYVFKTFTERIDKSTLFSYINKEKEFEKIKEQYELIMNICDSASGERIDFLKKAL